VIRNWTLLCAASVCVATIPLTLFAGPASFAQSTDDGDPDTDSGDDDVEVPDPDDSGGDNGADPDTGGEPADSGGDAADPADGGGDPGAEDAGDAGDAGSGGSDTGGDAGDAAPDADADDGAGDGGAAGSGDPSGDDDDDSSPAAGAGPTGGDDDDDDAPTSVAGGTSDDDDDDAAPATPGGGSDDDDDDAAAPSGQTPGDDDGPGNGDDVDEGIGPETILGGGDEDDAERAALDTRDGIEVDKDGFRYRKNEFVAVDLKPSEIALLQAEGFRVVETVRLSAIDSTVSLIKSPPRRSDQDMLSQIESMSDAASISFNYLFDTSTARVRKTAKTAVRKRTACSCDIGLVDTGVATKAGLFKHVQMNQKAFNGSAVVPKLHGTGVAYLFAGTENGKAKKQTRVFVADIFGGDRSHAGSSFALVKALDWMGQMKVSVINVSLAGPKSAAVAKAVEGLTRKGHIVVAAAGNDGPAAPPVFPGAYPGVVAVTAVDSQSKVYRYANRGNYIDLASHGVEVPLIDNSGVAVVATGTSFASPTVARKLARAMTKPDVAAAKAAVASIERDARDLGAPGRDNIYGHGLVSDGP
jgi:hypothetical protein